MSASSACQTSPPFRAEYVVEVEDTAAHLFHVTARFRNVHQSRLDIALPVWMPGAYEIRNYGMNVLRFAVSDGARAPLVARLTKPQTWTVDTQGKTEVVADFDYRADVRGALEANISASYAFFTGVQLFLEPVGHADAPAVVSFRVPAGWRIVSALRETNDPSVFTATDYHSLADSPTWLGEFDLYPFEVEGRPHYFVFERPGRHPAFPPESIASAVSRASSIIRVQSAIFDGLPYDKYVIFRIPGPEDPGGGDAIEHANSFVAIGTADLGSALDSHEFFHLWNVKRIRPAEMWPYDYSTPNVTPSLWFSEGVTSYYSDLTRFRAGLKSDSEFLDAVGRTLSLTSTDSSGRRTWNGLRSYVSPSDASVATWLGDSHWAWWSYYDEGEMLGALLDLAILHDTRAQHGLDDVLRRLYHDFYERQRGFTAAELLQTVNAVAGHDYTDFFRRFVAGTEVPPYDSIFGYAGIRVRLRYAGRIQAPQTVVEEGRRIDSITAGGAADAAGLRAGDIIVTVDGAPVNRFIFWCCKSVDGDGERAVLGILRGSTRFEAPIVLNRGPPISHRLVYDPQATADQLKVRSAWLARSRKN
jgi:predicted metalloprotease with PDZ domain